MNQSGQATITAQEVGGESYETGTPSGILSLVISQSIFTCDDVGVVPIVLTVTDGDGATDTCQALITVNPTDPVQARCGDISVYLDASGTATITPDMVDNGSAGSCGDPDLSLSKTDFDCSNLGPNTVVLTCVDTTNPPTTTTCEATVTVIDDIPPTVVAQDIVIQLPESGVAPITPEMLIDSESDNCGIVGRSTSITEVTCAEVGVVNVTVTVTDASGNTGSDVAQVTVEDVYPPNAICQDITVEIDLWGNPTTISPTDVDGGSTDNCGITTWSLDNDTFDCKDLGPNTVVLTVGDQGGNTATCEATVTVVDWVAPYVFVYTTQGLWLDDNNQAVLPDYTHVTQVWDNCDPNPVLTQDPPPGTIVSGASVVVTILATDASGNVGMGWFDVRLRENVAPELACPGDQELMLNADCEAEIPDYRGMATASDNSGVPPVLTQNPAPGTVIAGHNTSVQVTLTATDPSGNASQCSFTVTAKDMLPPTFTCCPDNQVVVLGGECSAAIPDYRGLASVWDNCSPDSILVQDPAPGTTISGHGTVWTVTLTATDEAGNVAVCTFNVTAEDQTPPALTCPGAQQVSLGENCEALIPDYTDEASVSDNCDESPELLQDPAPGQIIAGNNTSLTVTLTAMDSAGNVSVCNFVLTAKDTTPPQFVCPEDQTVDLDEYCQATIADFVCTTAITDNCDPEPVLVQDPPAGTVISGNGTTQVVTLTGTDVYGNSASCSFTVEAVDVTPPTINDPWCGTYAYVMIPCNDPDGAYYVPDAHDNCGWDYAIYLTDEMTGDGDGEMPYEPLVDNVIPFGPHEDVLVVVEDEAGNTAICTFNVEVIGDVETPMRRVSSASLDGEVRGPKPDGDGSKVDTEGNNMYIGVNGKHQEMISIVSFDIHDLPDNAFVLSANLHLTMTRHDFSDADVRRVVADMAIPSFGLPALQLSDRTSTATLYSVGSQYVDKNPSGTPVDIDMCRSTYSYLPSAEMVQFRLRLPEASVQDDGDNNVAFGTGNRGVDDPWSPQLVIEYYLPSCDGKGDLERKRYKPVK